jgi:biotin operon repressor
MDNNGWIKIHRKLLEWEWYTDSPTKDLFIHLLLVANHKPTKFRGIPIGIGETIRSLETLSNETKLSIQQVRTAISHMESTGELTQKQHGKYRVITIESYNEYQVINRETNKELTRNQQGTNSKQECKNEKNNIKELTNASSKKHTQFKIPEIEEMKKLFVEYNSSEEEAESCWDFYASKGWMIGKNKMKDWQAAARRWARSHPKPVRAPLEY